NPLAFRSHLAVIQASSPPPRSSFRASVRRRRLSPPLHFVWSFRVFHSSRLFGRTAFGPLALTASNGFRRADLGGLGALDGGCAPVGEPPEVEADGARDLGFLRTEVEELFEVAADRLRGFLRRGWGCVLFFVARWLVS